MVRFLQAFSFCGKAKSYLQGGVLPHKIVSLYLGGPSPKKFAQAISLVRVPGYRAVIFMWKGASKERGLDLPGYVWKTAPAIDKEDPLL